MYQEQPCMVVLMGEGRCTKNSPVLWFYWGREDQYGGVIGEGR